MKFGIKEFNFLLQDPCVVIAEVGVNHNGDPALARKLVDAAVLAKVDVVKFQLFNSEKEISRYASKAPYQAKNTSDEGNQLDMCKALELKVEVLEEMQKYCAGRGVGFLCTPFEFESVDLLVDRLKMETLKIGSGEITHIPLLEYVGQRCPGVILSTGASTLAEVSAAVHALKKGGFCRQILLLHCVTSYPADISQVNLRAMGLMRRKLGLPVGFSDHTLGIDVAIAAAALGAAAIEKHITLDRHLPGPDHRASIEPDELAEMVKGIREAQLALGKTLKEAQPCEIPNLSLVRKSLVAAKNLEAGTRLTRAMIEIKRPETGILPVDLPKVIGRVVKRNIEEDQPIQWEDLS